MRRDKEGNELLCAVNFSPNEIDNYRIGVTDRAEFVPVFNTEAKEFGGRGFGDTSPVKVEHIEHNGKGASISIKLPAFGGVFYKGKGKLKPVNAVKVKTAKKTKGIKQTAEDKKLK